jgi:hypothetical protein
MHVHCAVHPLYTPYACALCSAPPIHPIRMCIVQCTPYTPHMHVQCTPHTPIHLHSAFCQGTPPTIIFPAMNQKRSCSTIFLNIQTYKIEQIWPCGLMPLLLLPYTGTVTPTLLVNTSKICIYMNKTP